MRLAGSGNAMIPARLRGIEVGLALVLSILVGIMAAIRLTHAGGLWRDECAVLQLATTPDLSAIFANYPHEAFPPPFAMLLRLWSVIFGTSDIALRLYGFVIAVLLIVSLWVVSTIVKAGAPLISLAGVGLSSTFLIWGTSVRGYGIGTVIILLAFGFIGRLVMEKPPGTAVAVAVVTSILSLQLIVQNIVLLLAIVVSATAVCLACRGSARAILIGAIGLVSLLGFIPYVRGYLNAKEWNVVVQSTAPSPSLPHRLGEFFANMPGITAWAITFVMLGLVVIAARYLFTRGDVPAGGRDAAFFFLLVLMTSVIGSEIFFHWLKYAPQPWYSLPLFSLSIAAFDFLLARAATGGWLRFARVVVSGLGAVGLVVLNLSVVLERQTNIDLVARTVAEKASPDDLIVVNPWQIGIPFNWYYKGQTPWVTLPQISDHRIHRYDLIKQKMMATAPLNDLLEMAAATLRSGHHLWIVGGANLSVSAKSPSALPPAPGSQFGWDNVAYTRSWSREFGWFLRQHAREGEQVQPGETFSINPLENAPLWDAEGWKQ